MRYILEITEKGNEARTWNAINKLASNGYVTIVEKGDPVEDLKENMRRMVRAAEILKKAGIGRDIMEIYLTKKANVPVTHVRAVLNKQDEFFVRLGVRLK